MEKAKQLKNAVMHIKSQVEKFKAEHKSASQAVSAIIDELPFPFKTFARILWDGLEKEEDGPDKIIRILERIEGSTTEEFREIDKKLDDLINKQAASSSDLLEVGRELLNTHYAVLDTLSSKIDNLRNTTDSTYRNTQTILELLSKQEDESAKLSTDKDIFLGYRVVFDRPAFKRPYTWHSSKGDFVKAILDTNSAICTGRYITRHGDKLTAVKPKTFIKDKPWRDKMDRIEADLSEIIKMHYGLKEDFIPPAEEQKRFGDSVDSIRDRMIFTLNEIWMELGIPTLPIPSKYQIWDEDSKPLWDYSKPLG